jgi:hypothetical protein
MKQRHALSQAFYYFVKLPLFTRRISGSSFQRIDDIARICPDGPKVSGYSSLIRQACRSYSFLSDQDPEKLSDRYRAVSTIREGDVYLYPFINKGNVLSFNEFSGLEILDDRCCRGPVLVLYAHTGSYYEIPAATSLLGYKVFPIAFGTAGVKMEWPFKWFLGLNMKLSERLFRGGRYLYTGSSSFAGQMKQVLAEKERSLLYAALDLPGSFITERRIEVDFLGRRTALPSRIVSLFMKRNLPVVTAFPSVEMLGGRVRRTVSYEPMPEGLSTPEVLQVYAERLEKFIKSSPEQLLTLINMEGFFA